VRELILVKHAPPEVVPGVPPERWSLSEKGRALCVPLAEKIAAHQPAAVVSSEEPKAAETARLVAERLAVPWRAAPGLHEHDRSDVPHMRSGEFISMMELFFRRPGELVLGKETAHQARARFEDAVREVVGDRWSNANPEKRFRLQPFGGTAAADATFQGLTIPTSVAAGNHYGTDDYLPFFQARITRAQYF